jgi:ketosteroid isomerase-like protein
MKKYFIFIIMILFLASCGGHNRPEKKSTSTTDSLLKSDTSAAKKEVLNTCNEFVSFSETNGVKEAFGKYMSETGVLLKSNRMPIEGRDSVVSFFGKKKFKDLKVTRTPTLIDVSKSGDLAYVYGTYKADATGPKGNSISSTGSYVSIWKKNTENWELVLECENEGLVPLNNNKKAK